MLGRHIATYLPAVVVPAAVSLGSLVVYSRILQPAEYGHLALVMAVTMVTIGLCSRWLTIGITRLYPAAERDLRSRDFLVTVLVICTASLGVVLLTALTFALFAGDFGIGPEGASHLALSGVLILAARTLVVCTNSLRRARLQVVHYAVVECSQAAAGFAVALLFGTALGWNARSILFGTAIGYAAVAALETGSLLPEIRGGRLDRNMLTKLLVFAGPLTLTYGLALLLASADQFFVQALLGSSAGGLYGAATSIANRSVVLIFSGISMVVFPMSVRALEHEGKAACVRRERQNLELVVATALPAATFLAVAAPQVVHLLLGSAYRDAAVSLLPWIVGATFLNRMAVDVFDHAFYLAQRTSLLFATLIPAAVASVALSLLMIPLFGVLGAALSKIVEAAIMLLLSICIGARLLPIGLSRGPIIRIGLATLTMALVVGDLTLPLCASSFALLVVTGAGVYGLCALILDVMGVRRHLMAWMQAGSRLA